jgi:CubicO group peptidase (beta-lactamase class C family)
MKPYKFLTLALSLFCMAAFSQRQAATPSPYDLTELTRKLEASKKELGKSFAVLIYKDGKVVYDKKIGEELDKKTQIPIAASSQWLTAALVMTFVDEGKLTLDTKVSDYLPIFNTYGKSYITIRHCLAHMSGIQSKKSISGFTSKSKTEKLEEEVNEFVKKEIENNAGEALWYSNIGPSIAARVLEVMTKRPFERLLSDRITRRLMMRGTTFNTERAINAAGGASSSAMDYMNFMTMILNKGMFNGQRILSEKAIEDMFTAQMPQSQIKYVPDAAKGYDIGLGTIIQEKDEKGKATVVSCPSFYGTWVMADLCRGYAFEIFSKEDSNESSKTFYAELKAIVDKVIGGDCK